MTDSSDPSNKPSVNAPRLDQAMRVPDTSMLADATKPSVAGEDLMKRVVQGAHDTIDRLADGAAPTVRQLGQRVTSAEDAVRAQTTQMRETGDEWAESLRRTVRSSPLVAVLAAVALGALVVRISR